jgi:hypothetical protein
MPFGKYRGQELSEIDDSRYLLWVLDNVESLSPTLRKAIEQHLGVNQAAPPTNLTAVVPTWYRKLALEFHPDRRGGNHEGMKAINRAKELLIELAEVSQ